MVSKKKTKTDSPFVSYEKLVEAIDVLKKMSEVTDDQKTTKMSLLSDPNERMIQLKISYKKIPQNKTTYIHSISLPNHWRHESDFETCLIVKDLNKTPLTDRDLDLDQTKSHYKELLSKDNSDVLVTEVLPMRELRNEYKPFEAKQKLSKGFNVFLCDRKLLHNKFDYLSRFLGKIFWIDSKKVPIPVDLSSGTLKADLETKLNQTQLYLSGKGDTTAINIGLLKQSTDKLADNLLAVTTKASELFGSNVRSLSLKTDKSISITFFLDCGFISDVQLNRILSDNKPIEDEFSHFINSNVQVFNSGTIKVVPKAKEDIDKSEEIDAIELKWLSRNRKKPNRKRNKKIHFSVRKRFKGKKTDKTVVK